MFFQRDFNSYIERGNQYLGRQNYKAAFQEFNKAVEVASDEVEQVTAYFNRGRIYFRLNGCRDR
jgi:tetratricopeptide (TPR) repeat protein